jgi:hypothetical protein
MLEEINQALNEGNYSLCQELLENLKKEQPEHPWIDFYQARLQEEQGELELAEIIYKGLLLTSINRQLLSQARQGFERVVKLEKARVKEKLQEALEKAKKEEGNEEIGLLILEPIEPHLKQLLAPNFAKIMNIDPYTAKLKLPTKNWCLSKVGNLAQLKSYQQNLLDVKIPCFSVKLTELNTITVYQVKYLESINGEITVICKREKEENISVSFKWEEINQRVEVLLPIFEKVVEIDNKRNLYKKTKTSDYVQILDLHLREKNTIIRFEDYIYDFNQGIQFPKQNQGETKRENWNNLKHFLQPYLINIPLKNEFEPFAEKALDFPEMLKQIKSNITLFRREETLWDAAFELYSGLILIHSTL